MVDLPTTFKPASSWAVSIKPVNGPHLQRYAGRSGITEHIGDVGRAKGCAVKTPRPRPYPSDEWKWTYGLAVLLW